MEKSPSRAYTKGKRLRKDRQPDDESATTEPSSDSEKELEELVKKRKKNNKFKTNTSRAKLTRVKIARKGQVVRENIQTGRVSLHVDDDNEVAGNLNDILKTNKESEDEDSDSGLKSLIKELEEDQGIEQKLNKDPADIANKVW